MPCYYRFFWTPESEQHVGAHGITKEEFEEVVLAATLEDVEPSKTTDRLTVSGYTGPGRRITCVYEEIDEITCFPVTAWDQ